MDLVVAAVETQATDFLVSFLFPNSKTATSEEDTTGPPTGSDGVQAIERLRAQS